MVSHLARLLTVLAFAGCTTGLHGQHAADGAGSDQRPGRGPLPIELAILNDPESPFSVNVKTYPRENPNLPVGIFDSGTGGLTVMDALLRYDRHDNRDHTAGTDKQADFAREKFIYLADQANMPYGNYHSENKSALLVEHVLKDVAFLLGDNYYPGAAAAEPTGIKQPVKAIVIACNTATAYAKKDVEQFIGYTGTDLKVIGVIDAGARGALEGFEKGGNGTIGVLATVGTVASGGYEHTIERFIRDGAYSGDIRVISQGGQGMAEAVDQEPDFVDHQLRAPRENYRGPALNHPDYRIEKALLDVYNFNFDDYKMLCRPGREGDCEVLQLNSPANYMRYHLVSLMENLRNTPGAPPLKALVLGCTHYPYLTSTIQKVLKELYNYRRNGKYIYRQLMAEDIRIIDPAENVAAELYEYLHAQELFNPSGSTRESQFFISIPNTGNKDVQTDSLGRFTYDYKYGREAGRLQEYVKVVPFSQTNIPEETILRLERMVPAVYELMAPLPEQ